MHWYFNAQNPDKIRTLRKDRGNLLPVAFYARESTLARFESKVILCFIM